VVTSRQRTLLGSPHNDNNAIKANGLLEPSTLFIRRYKTDHPPRLSEEATGA
jgi:hypothetical protein